MKMGGNAKQHLLKLFRGRLFMLLFVESMMIKTVAPDAHIFADELPEQYLGCWKYDPSYLERYKRVYSSDGNAIACGAYCYYYAWDGFRYKDRPSLVGALVMGACYCIEDFTFDGPDTDCYSNGVQCSLEGVCGGQDAFSVWRKCAWNMTGDTCDEACDCGNALCGLNKECLPYCRPGYRPTVDSDELCAEPCPPGMYGVNCLAKCDTNCKDGECDPVLGYCLYGCQPGFFGPWCTKRCPNQLNLHLDHDYNCPLCRHCYENRCAPAPISEKGDEGRDCSTVFTSFYDDSDYDDNKDCYCYYKCPRQWQGPVCAKCDAERYGLLCNETCPLCLNGACDQLTGRCLLGCIAGYMGDNCTQCEDPDNCPPAPPQMDSQVRHDDATTSRPRPMPQPGVRPTAEEKVQWVKNRWNPLSVRRIEKENAHIKSQEKIPDSTVETLKTVGVVWLCLCVGLIGVVALVAFRKKREAAMSVTPETDSECEPDDNSDDHHSHNAGTSTPQKIRVQSQPASAKPSKTDQSEVAVDSSVDPDPDPDPDPDKLTNRAVYHGSEPQMTTLTGVEEAEDDGDLTSVEAEHPPRADLYADTASEHAQAERAAFLASRPL